jgi:hypothetical protein
MAELPNLWLGQKGGLVKPTLTVIVKRRGKQAGIPVCIRTNSATPSPTSGARGAEATTSL